MRRLIIAAVTFAVMQSYGSTVMIVNSTNGSRDVYQLSDVMKMTFANVTTGARMSGSVLADNSFLVANNVLRLFITRPTMISARLFSCNGRVYGMVHDKQYAPGSYVLPLDKTGSLAKGVYIMQLTMAGKVYNHRMVVSR